MIQNLIKIDVEEILVTDFEKEFGFFLMLKVLNINWSRYKEVVSIGNGRRNLLITEISIANEWVTSYKIVVCIVDMASEFCSGSISSCIASKKQTLVRK